MGDHQEDPQDTHAADAPHADDHGDHRIPRPSQGVGQNLNERPHEVEGHKVEHDADGVLDDLRVVGEDLEGEGGDGQKDAPQNHRQDQGHFQADLHALAHPVVSACPVVLAHKGHDGRGEGHHQGPVDTVQLTGGRPGGHIIGAQVVDGDLDDQVGDGVHGGLDGGRNADVQHMLQGGAVDPNLSGNQTVVPLRPGQLEEDENSAHQIGQHCGQGSAGLPHVEDSHKDQVQDHVQQAADDEVVQGPLGIAHCPEDTGAHVEQEDGNGSQENDSQVADGRGHDLFRVSGPAEGIRGQPNTQKGDDTAGQNAEGDGGMDSPAEFFLVLGAEGVGDDHGGTGRKAGEEAHHKLDDDSSRTAHGGQGIGPHELAHDDGIGGVVKLLEQSAHSDGDQKEQQLLPDDALGQVQGVVGFVRHGGHSFLQKSPISTDGKKCGTLLYYRELKREKQGPRQNLSRTRTWRCLPCISQSVRPRTWTS